MSEADGVTTHSNWCDKFTAIEVFNGKRISQAQPVLHDWFNLLNIGYRFTATGNSDSHKVFDAEPGYPRNYIMLPKAGNSGQSKTFDVTDVAKAVNQKHSVFVTDGPILHVQGPGGSTIGEEKVLKTGPVEFKVRVEGANFVQPNHVELIANGKVVQVRSFPETSAPLKWEGMLSDNPTTDTWYVVIVRGDHSMFPIVTPDKVDGVEHHLMPLAFCNPMWIDRDGDGKFTALNQDKHSSMHEDRSAEAKQQLEALTNRSQERNQFKKAAKKPGES